MKCVNHARIWRCGSVMGDWRVKRLDERRIYPKKSASIPLANKSRNIVRRNSQINFIGDKQRIKNEQSRKTNKMTRVEQ